MVKKSHPVFLFVGNDSYLKEKAIKDLVSSLPGTSSQDLDHKVFYGGEASQDEILDHINTIPFLASKRLVVVKDLEKTSKAFMSALMNYVKNPLHSTCLILEASGDSVLRDHPGISRYASVRKFGELSPREVDAWIKDFLAARKKKITADAAAMLIEMHGSNLLALTQELDKLAVFTGKDPEIKRGDIEEAAGRSLVASTFDLADAIGSGRTEGALRICRSLLSEGKKEFEIIGLLAWHFKRLLKAKTLQARGEGDNRIASALRISPAYRAGFFRQVSGLNMGRIKAGIRALLEADLDIKRTRFDYTRSNLVLEFAVIKLSRLSATPLAAGRGPS